MRKHMGTRRCGNFHRSSMEELLKGPPWRECVSPNDPPGMAERLERHQRQTEWRVFEHRLREAE